MKKSWIIVLAFVFLWSAVPAFSVPVPSELCLYRGDSKGPQSIRLILNSEGKIGSVEYFRVTGSWVWDEGSELLTGSGHRQGKKVLHLGLTGTYDAVGPGGGDDLYFDGLDVRYNLKKGRGVWSWISLAEDGGNEETGPFAAVDCASLPKPSW